MLFFLTTACSPSLWNSQHFIHFVSLAHSSKVKRPGRDANYHTLLESEAMKHRKCISIRRPNVVNCIVSC